MSKFGQTNVGGSTTQKAPESKEGLEGQVSETTKQDTAIPSETDTHGAAVNPPPSTDSLAPNATSANALLEARGIDREETASEADVLKAHQTLADALQAQAAQIQHGVSEQSLVAGNVVSGAMTTNNSAIDLLNKLGSGQAYDNNATAQQTRPAGYYTVHTGSLPSKAGKRVQAQSIGGLFYFDPKDLDEVGKASMEKLIKAGMASHEE